MGISVFLFWWRVTASASATYDIIFFNVTHYVRMGPVSRGYGMILKDTGFEIR